MLLLVCEDSATGTMVAEWRMGLVTWKLRQENICSTRRLKPNPTWRHFNQHTDLFTCSSTRRPGLGTSFMALKHIPLLLICLSTCFSLLCHFISSGSFGVFPCSVQALWMISPSYLLLLSFFLFSFETFSVSKCSCLNPLKCWAGPETGHWSSANRWTERGSGWQTFREREKRVRGWSKSLKEPWALLD